jgi:hypothetical protein
MRACRYAGVDFCAAHGLSWGPIVEAWALAAEAAEGEAEAELVKRAQRKAGR